MAGEKRKDSNGRILKTGETQRPNGTYMYRYKDATRQTCWAYAPTLKELRDKEEAIQRDKLEGIQNRSSKMTVAQLIERFRAIDAGVRRTTARSRKYLWRVINREPFAQMQIKDVRQSNAKALLLHFSKDLGYTSGTVSIIHSVLKQAFEIAVQDDYIRKNPFNFKTSSIVNKCSVTKDALAPEQQHELLEFMKEGTCTRKWYSEIVILHETGVRVSELCGITFDDVDLDERCLRINKQLMIEENGTRFINRTKSKSGERMIPLTDAAVRAFQDVISRRPKLDREIEIDGHTGFIFLNRNKQPKVCRDYERFLKSTVIAYNKCHDTPLPHITPHMLRHTFITNSYNAGLDLKSLQVVAGHSDIKITLDVYTHADFNRVRDEFMKVTNGHPQGD